MDDHDTARCPGPNIYPLLSVLALAMAACGEAHPNLVDPNALARRASTGTVAAALQCTPDLAVLQTPRECYRDDDCACGAHCDMGACNPGCTTGTACAAGEWCDVFGRCRLDRDDQLLAAIKPQRQARLTVAPRSLLLPAAGEGRIRVIVSQAASAGLRVQGTDGVEVRCAVGQPFSNACRTAPLPARGRLELEVRANAPIPANAPSSVQVWAEKGFAEVLVRTRAAPPVAPLEGRYVGTVRREGAGLGRHDGNLSARASAEELEIDAEVFEAERVIVISDRFGRLHPSGAIIGTIDGGSVSFPPFMLFSGDDNDPDRAEVIAVPHVLAFATDGNGGRTLRLSLRFSYHGIVDPAAAPFSQLEVALSRVGGLEPGRSAPAVPAPASTALPPVADRSAARTGWEAAVRAIANDGTLSTADRDAAFDSYAQRDFRLDACHLAAADRARLADDAHRLHGWRNGGHMNPSLNFQHPNQLNTMNGNGLLIALRQGLINGGYGTRTGDQTEVSVDPRRSAYSGLDGSPIEDALPCAANFERLSFPSASGTVHVFPAALDECQSVRNETGCEILPVNESVGRLGRILRGSIRIGSTSQAIFNGTDIIGRVTQVCSFPEQPVGCGEMSLCIEPRATGGALQLATSRLGSALTPLRREARCLASNLDAGPELDRRFEAVYEMATACGADLDRRSRRAPAVTPQTPLSQVFGGGDCIDPARWVSAMGLASEHLRQPRLPFEPVEARLFHRLAQRWIELSGFVARDRAQNAELAAVIGRLDVQSGRLPPPIDSVMATSLRAWDLLLHPRFAAALDALPAEVLRDPDYRLDLAAHLVVESSDTQPEGIPLTMLEVLLRQVELAERAVDQARFHRDLGALDLLPNLFARVRVVEAMALGLAARATEGAAVAPAWLERFERTHEALANHLRGLITAARALDQGDNPLGLDEDDIPLYLLDGATSPGRRFSAVSDFLVGESPNALRWAPFLVREASLRLDNARLAWAERSDRSIARSRDFAELDRSLGMIRQSFGEQVAEMCGAPGGLATRDLIEHWETGHGRPFSGDDCYIDLSNPACVPVATSQDPLTRDDAQYQLCMASELRARLGTAIGYRHSGLHAALTAWDHCSNPSAVSVGACTVDGVQHEQCYRCGGIPGPSGATVLQFPLRPQDFASLDTAGTPDDVLEEASDVCAGRWPNAAASTPRTSSPTDANQCFRGAIGEMVLTVRSTALEVEIARTQAEERSRAYDIAMQSCFRLESGNQAIADAETDHNRTMTGLRSAQLALDVAALAARALAECADALGSASLGAIFSGGAAPAIECGAHAAQSGFEAASASFGLAIAEVGQAHETTVARLERSIEQDRCFIEAQQELVAYSSLTMRIAQAMNDLGRAQLELDNRKIAVESAFQDGVTSLAAEQGRFVVPLLHDAWLDDRVQAFSHSMREARRLTYLAVRAAEYEYQQTLASADGPLSELVLAATLPLDLDRVLSHLWSTSGTRGIRGRRPEDLGLVVSLKRQLLRRADRSQQPPWELRLDEDQRFRLLLTDPAHAVYGEDGAYLGQRIPFSLAPSEMMGLTNIPEVAAAAPGDCAERVWSVNASIMGEPGLVRGDDASFVRLDLEKANTFYSRWCAPPAGGEDYQMASVHPSRNLFREPGVGVRFGEDLMNGGDQVVSRARIRAFLGVARGELSRPTYSDGASTELAGRGLFGDYALFFPAAVISRANERGERSTGIDLERVEDIFLRLDYVSVAK